MVQFIKQNITFFPDKRPILEASLYFLLSFYSNDVTEKYAHMVGFFS